MRRDIFFGAAALARLATAQDDEEERVEECFPDDPSAPCVSIENIEAVCMQRGISLEDHKKCMCEGSFFEDWLGCRQCLRVNGALAEVEVDYWSSVLGEASTALCDSDATPTTYWQAYFGGAGASVPGVTVASGDLERSTLVSETDVSYYYTAPDDQGPGITPTITSEPETETDAQTSATTTTSTDESESTETETETETGDGNGDDDGGAAGRLYAQGAASVAAIVAVAALFMVM